MRRQTWWALGLAVAGLAGCGVESHQEPSRFDGKLEARERLTEPGFVPTPGEDVCADNEWYDDGECDYWCPDADGDCAEEVYCAAYVEESDGLCQRAPSDPCRSQDPDCMVSCVDLPIFPGTDGVCSYDPADPCVGYFDRDCQGVACAEYIEMPDGVCSRADDDECRFQDPDCDDGGVIVCPAIAQFPDGVCTTDPNDPCVEASDPDCGNQCAAVDYPVPPVDGICTQTMDPCAPEDPDCTCSMGLRAAPPADGVCTQNTDPCGAPDPDCECAVSGGADAFPGAPIAPPMPGYDGVCNEDNDPCTPVDPDCVACADYIEQPDGMCSREELDPCKFQDPDCTTACLTPGARPIADGVCIPTGNPCAVDPDCTTCAFFAPPPPPDGVCDGNPDDACSFQGDPDCDVACTLIIEVANGQCERFSTDKCIGQDPDCQVVDCALVDPNPNADMICALPLDASCRMADPDCAVDL